MPTGLIRFVNPDRGLATAAIAGRMLAFTRVPGEACEIVALEGGCQYHPGRSFSPSDLEAIRDGGVLDPSEWDWRVFGPWGVDRLKNPPGRAELAELAGEALRLGSGDDRTFLDRFEVWAADRTSGRPLALVATAVDYIQAEAIGFWPGPTGRITNRYDHTGDVWRFGEHLELPPEVEEFQRRVNAKIRIGAQSGLYPFLRRIFERLPDGSAVEHGRGHTRAVPPAYLPRGHLAEPLESERVLLLRRSRTGTRPIVSP